MKKLLALLAAVLAPTLTPTQALATSFAEDPEVAAFITEMHEKHGFETAWLSASFARLRPNEAVLRAIKPAVVPELQRSWERYRARFLNERRITAGVRFWQAHEATLKRASAIFGVPEEIIVAIIGVETEYGKNTGRFSVMQALSTLAFNYPPRAPFFRSELEQFLLLARDNSFDPLSVKGSYAGAIGIPQFMPSSQQRYAVDFDGNGRVELTSSTTDAIGSVASFLAQHGW
ncbi:MAG: lytic murein transglycosylase, partial [Rhodocyclaceae bacterium]